jgi:hypothetical protein
VDLTPGSISGDICPRLSQDASKVSYAAQKGQWDASYTYDNTIVMNPDGSGKYVLEMQTYFGGMDNWGSLNANGSKIVLQKTGDYTVEPTSLYLATINPFVSTRLTSNNYDGWPTWKSDGTMIAFVSKRLNGPNGTYQLMMMKPEPESATNVPVQLTTWADGEAAMPYGTPDGKILVLKKISDYQQEIFRCDFADSNGDGVADNLTQVTNLGRFITSVSQPVAGGKIYFAATGNDGKSHVFTVNNDGSGLHQVTGGNFDEASPYAAGNKLVASINDPNNGVNNYDVMIYTLNTAAGTGTVSGKLTTSAGAPLAGASVAAYDGDTGAGDATTDANGNYTLTLPAGGYTLVFATNTPTVYEVKRSVAVQIGGATTQDAFTTPVASPRPRGTIATIKAGKVEVKWAAAGTPDGYNVYRATAETGPWTKITSTPVSPVDPVKYIDNTPGNLASVFYKVTGVTGGVESAFSEVAQAANNLLWNPSFEQVDSTTGEPIGWTYGTWGGDGTHGTSTAIKADGTRSIFIKTGATERGAGMYHLDLPFYPPTQPGVAMVEGVWGKFTDTNTTWPLALMQAPWVSAFGYIPWWYPQDWVQGPGLSQWDTDGLTVGGGDTPWTWLYNTNNVVEWEFTQGTRFSILWPNDGLTTLGSSTAYADDATLQVKRFGATGWVMGRILDTNGHVPSGITVTCGGKSIATTSSDLFVIKDVPTGDQTLTIKAPGQPDYTLAIGNYGGYMMPTVHVVPAAAALIIKGTVRYPNGTPCPGADVRLITCGAADAQVAEFTTTADANGAFSLGSDTVDVSSQYVSHLVAHKKGFLSARLDVNFGLSGTSAGNDITLIQPSAFIEIAKTAATITIDGHVNPSEWAGSQVIRTKVATSASRVPTVNTTIYALWDSTNVYFAFICDEPNPAGIFADPSVSLWGAPPYWNGHDMAELRIDPTNGCDAGQGHEWWQIMNNTATPVFNDNIIWRRVAASLWGDNSPISGYEVASYIDTAGLKWYQEVKIPFASLSTTYGMTVGTPAVGDEWAINLARQRHQPDPVGESSSIGVIPPGQDVSSIAHFVTTSAALPKGDLNGDRVVNLTDAAISLRIAAGLEWIDGRFAQADINGDGKADLSDTVKIIRKINGLDTSF